MITTSGRKWSIPSAVVALLVLGAWLSLPARPMPTPRNVILISIDTLRADHLHSYGYERETSPELDAFARRSTRFERAITHGESTLPGHGAMLSSRYYGSYNASLLPAGPPADVDLLAGILKRDGFATWGFVDGGFLRRVFGFDRGFDHYEDQRVKIKTILERVNPWLDTHHAERFFLFVHCYDVHTPYNAPDPFGSMFVDPAYTGSFRPNAGHFDAVEGGSLPFGPDDLRYAIARYDGGIRHVDHQIGTFLKRLEQTGLLDSTLVVVTSDHGEEFLEHGGFQHKKIYDYPNLHVPLIIHAPGRPARVVEHPVEIIDVVPTILELLGLPPHPGAMGRSLATLVEGGSDDGFAGRIGFAESSLPGVGWRTVVSRRYQLLYDVKSGEQQLYDLESDPREQRNIAASEPATVAELVRVLRERLAENARRNHASSVARTPLDEETRRQLRALGYMEE